MIVCIDIRPIMYSLTGTNLMWELKTLLCIWTQKEHIRSTSLPTSETDLGVGLEPTEHPITLSVDQAFFPAQLGHHKDTHKFTFTMFTTIVIPTEAARYSTTGKAEVRKQRQSKHQWASKSWYRSLESWRKQQESFQRMSSMTKEQVGNGTALPGTNPATSPQPQGHDFVCQFLPVATWQQAHT